eukprot:3466979-Prymnesium_polylepis.1
MSEWRLELASGLEPRLDRPARITLMDGLTIGRGSAHIMLDSAAFPELCSRLPSRGPARAGPRRCAAGRGRKRNSLRPGRPAPTRPQRVSHRSSCTFALRRAAQTVSLRGARGEHVRITRHRA